MHILFALIFFVQAGSTGPALVRVGVYEKFAQCQRQGRELVRGTTGNSYDDPGRWGGERSFQCVAVNG